MTKATNPAVVDPSFLIEVYNENIGQGEAASFALQCVDEMLFPHMSGDNFATVYMECILAFFHYITERSLADDTVHEAVFGEEGWSLPVAIALAQTEDGKAPWDTYLRIFLKHYDQTDAGILAAIVSVDYSLKESIKAKGEQAVETDGYAMEILLWWIERAINKDHVFDIAVDYWDEHLPAFAVIWFGEGVDNEIETRLQDMKESNDEVRAMLTFTETMSADALIEYVGSQTEDAALTVFQISGDSEEEQRFCVYIAGEEHCIEDVDVLQREYALLRAENHLLECILADGLIVLSTRAKTGVETISGFSCAKGAVTVLTEKDLKKIVNVPQEAGMLIHYKTPILNIF